MTVSDFIKVRYLLESFPFGLSGWEFHFISDIEDMFCNKHYDDVTLSSKQEEKIREIYNKARKRIGYLQCA